MKATLPWFAALLLAVAACTMAQAGPFSHCCHPCPPCPQANAFSPPCCCPTYCGPVFSNPLPPYPFNGLRPCLGNEGGAGGNGFPGYNVHPFAHSPRDFFMVD
jgi:hypothetical protein